MKLVKRSAFGWGPTEAAYARPTRGLVIHYDGSNQGLADKPHTACVTYWKNTRRFHMGPARGWADLGYSFGVCPHGEVLEGRGLNRIQAAQPGGNDSYYSVSLMSGPKERPTAAQINAVRELRAWLMGMGVGPLVKGHRDFYSTSCPGDLLYGLVRDGTFTKAPTKQKPKPAPTPKPKPQPKPDPMEAMLRTLPHLKIGDGRKDNDPLKWDVKTLHYLLLARDCANFDGVDDTEYTQAHADGVRAIQGDAGLPVTGRPDLQTWAALLRAL
jgi:peptidoglycan hydrolase-like protein with peptidoglycan-binding domain